MNLIRKTTAIISITAIFAGGILESFGWQSAEPLILLGVVLLILVYIPVFLLHISKKWDQEDSRK